MKLRKFFNIILLIFCLTVPLLPFKIKISILPLSADFIIGGILIVTGFIVILDMHKKRENLKELFDNRAMRFLTIFIALFGIMSTISIIYAGNKGLAISEEIRFIEYIAIFYLVIIISDRKTIDNGFRIFYLAMIIASIYGVIQYVFNWSEFINGGFWGRGRIYATFVNPNYWGAAINMVIYKPIINIIEKKKIKNNVIIFLLFFFNLFFTSTRGSWFAFAVGLFVIGLFKYKKQVYYSLGLLVAVLLLPITRNRIFDYQNIIGRLKLWKTGLYMFKDHMLLGVGNGNYIAEYKRYVRVLHKELSLGPTEYSVHNSYLKMFTELGIFGGIVFAAMYFCLFNLIFKIYRNSVRYKSWALMFTGFGAAYLLQNFSNNLAFIPQFNVFVWLLTAFLYKGLYLEGNLPK